MNKKQTEEFKQLVELFQSTKQTTSKELYKKLLGRVLIDPSHDRYPIQVCYLGMGLENKPENKEIMIIITQEAWVTRPWYDKLKPFIGNDPNIQVSITKESRLRAKIVITYKDGPRNTRTRRKKRTQTPSYLTTTTNK